MIDLKKPLEGVPGVLLLAALILFGATIGVTAALLLSWVEMKDSIANFLGGVVGAGLGAALAVFGAVYVQRRDYRARLTAPINQTVSEVENLATQLNILKFLVDPPSLAMFSGEDEQAEAIDKFIRDVRSTVAKFPRGVELPGPVHSQIRTVTSRLGFLLGTAESYASADPEGIPKDLLLKFLDSMLDELKDLGRQLHKI